MLEGFNARELNARDRLTLETRTQIMRINGASEEKIAAYVLAFRSEFKPEPLPEGFGRDFVEMLGRMGYALPLVLFIVHTWGR